MAMEASILESLGAEIIGVMSPVSICMFLVVLLVSVIPPSKQSLPRTAATLFYLESSSDSPAQKLQGALMDAAAFVAIVTIATFMLVLLYYYRLTHFLKHYTSFSAFLVFSTMGSPIFLAVIEHLSIPLDAFTAFIVLFNFTVIGVLSIFSQAVPIFIRQCYMVLLAMIVAAWFTRLPEWTTWILLLSLAVYDLVAVLTPVGPLKLLVDLASSREEDLPALVYESRPTACHNAPAPIGLLVHMVDNNSQAIELTSSSTAIHDRPSHSTIEIEEEHQCDETLPFLDDSDDVEQSRVVGASINSQLEGHATVSESHDQERSRLIRSSSNGSEASTEFESRRGIRLGLGDFVFYSVMVGRAAIYDPMTAYACYLAIISGLGCTLILLSVYRKALPALPISIALGVLFYFSARLLMEPFIVKTSTNLLMI